MSDSDNEGKVLEEVTEEFVEVVKSWVTIDDEIRKKTAEIKELKDERKEFETFILEYMDKLRKNKSNTKGGLKQESIQSTLLDITQDTNKAMEMTKRIMDDRPMTERVNLKRTKNRGQRKKKSNNKNQDI